MSFVKAFKMDAGQDPKAFRPQVCKGQKNTPTIGGIAHPKDEARRFETADEFHGAMVLQQQPFRKIANAGAFGCFEGANGQKRLKSLRRQPVFRACLFAVRQNLADHMAKLLYGTVLVGAEVRKFSIGLLISQGL